MAMLTTDNDNSIPRILTAQDVCDNDLIRPFVLTEKATEHWISRRKWVTPDGKPDFIHLKAHFGASLVPVADCHIKDYNAQKKEDSTLSNYIYYWTELIADNYNYGKHKCLYLKDWHFMKEFPDTDCYEVPECFISDWLNEFWNQRKDVHDDYRFVYMGPKDSWTPLHVDVFSSYSWSANICGIKKWILFPPEEEENLKDCLGNLAYDVTSPVMSDNKGFPNFHKIRCKYEVLQMPGEVIFVPSLWLHQVHNMEDTISINHNWFNGSNIDIIWKSLSRMLIAVESEIGELREMEGWNQQCQLILKATHGMNCEEFDEMLSMIAKFRLNELNISKRHKWSNFTRIRQIVFDLEKIKQIISAMLTENSVTQNVEIKTNLYNKIQTAIDCINPFET